MTPQVWQQVVRILNQALDLPPAERQPYVESECRSDAALLADVETMLSAYDRSQDSFEPAALLPDQFCRHNRGLELLMKLEPKWPAFNLQRLAESVDRQYVQMGLGIHNESPLLARCKSLRQEPSASAGTIEAAADG